MRFDDRLLTVLNQPAEDRHDAAVRWRQLVDLVARAGSNSASPLVAEALGAIRAGSGRVHETLRAATARAVASFPLPIGLLKIFVADRLSVSAPVLAAATLEGQQWAALLATADEETRRFITALHPELKTEPTLGSLSPPTPTVEPSPLSVALSSSSQPPAQTAYRPPSLHEVVERIERRQQQRAQQSSDPEPKPTAPPEPPALFRWECGPGGEIVWVEGAPRGALVGRSLAKSQDSDGDRLDQAVVRAFAARAPFRDAGLSVAGEGPVSGEWKVSGVPAFEPSDGRFAGYRGVALRETKAEMPTDGVPSVLADPDSLRELVHEIKTPLNAIIGFAEIIEGQYLGPADSGYRARASEIVRQAHLLLTAIDDLDFAAKVHSVASASSERVDLAALVDRASGELREIALQRRIDVDFIRPHSRLAARAQPELADRLLIRLFGAIAARATPGERLICSVESIRDSVKVSISRSAALRGVDERALLGIAKDGVEPNDGFAFRLVRGLARIAGGQLIGSRDFLSLVFARA